MDEDTSKKWYCDWCWEKQRELKHSLLQTHMGHEITMSRCGLVVQYVDGLQIINYNANLKTQRAKTRGEQRNPLIPERIS